MQDGFFRSFQIGFLLVCVFSPAPGLLAAEESALDLSKPYLLLGADEPYILQNQLSQAGAAGYRVVASWSGREMCVLLESSKTLNREYRVVAALDLSVLEAELEEAAAQGFRLIPEGVFRNGRVGNDEGQEVVLLFERVPDLLRRYQYLLKESSYDYQMVPDFMDRDLVPAGSLSKEPLERDLLELMQRGFDVVALVKRIAEVVRREGFGSDEQVLHVQHILIGEKRIGPSGHTRPVLRIRPGPDRDLRYRLIVHGDTNELQTELNQLASSGYRLVLTSQDPIPQLVGVLEKKSGSNRYEYLVLETSRVSTMRKEVNEAASQGFRPHRRGIFREPLLVVLERDTTAEVEPSFKLLTQGRTERLRSELLDAVDQGYGFTGVSAGGSLMITREGSVPSLSRDSTQQVASDPPSYTVDLKGQDAGEIQEHLNQAVDKGYCITGPSGFDPFVLTLEQFSDASEVCGYKILTSDKASILEEQLNQVSTEGYRLSPLGFYGRNRFAGADLQALTERVVSLESYEYRVLSTVRISTMQKELNQAAAEGFRLVPSTFLERQGWYGSDELVVVVEKGPDSGGGAEYQLLSTNHASSLDEEIVDAHGEGFELIYKFRRMHTGPFVEPNLAILERTSPESAGPDSQVAAGSPEIDVASAQGTPPMILQIRGGKPSKIEKMLNKAADQGFCFKAVTEGRRGEIVLTKRFEPPEKCEFQVLAKTKSSTLQKELDQAAASGFRLVPFAAYPKKTLFRGDEVVAILEKAPDSQETYRYRVLSTQFDGTLNIEIEQARNEGFELKDRVTRGDHPLLDSYIAFMELPASVAPERSADDPPKQLSFGGQNMGKIEKQLTEAGAQGYRFTSVSEVGGNLFGDHLLFRMERCPEPSLTYKYRVLSTVKAATIEEELNSASANGFQVIPETILVKATGFGAFGFLAVLEKGPEFVPPLEYRVLSTKQESTLKEEIELACSEGYQLVKQVYRAGDHVAFLERPARQ